MRSLPNLLSFARLVLMPFAVAAILGGRYRQALALFAVAALTDGLDGYLARLLDARTRLGAYLDPLADKALLIATYLALALAGAAPWWLVGLVFARDLLILAMVAAALLFTPYREFPPSIWGKISTWLQILAAMALLVARAFPAGGLWPAPFLWAAAAATLWSGAAYLLRGARLAAACRAKS